MDCDYQNFLISIPNRGHPNSKDMFHRYRHVIQMSFLFRLMQDSCKRHYSNAVVP